MDWELRAGEIMVRVAFCGALHIGGLVFFLATFFVCGRYNRGRNRPSLCPQAAWMARMACVHWRKEGVWATKMHVSSAKT